MIKAYTISGLKALKYLPKLDTVQFTLNHRTFPGKRQTVKALSEVSRCCESNIIIHYDFIYIASRFSMFSPQIKDAIMQEIVSIMQYALRNNNIKGIVMHTDFALKREVFDSPTPEKIQDSYGSNTWDTELITSMVQNLNHFTENNLREFYYTFKEYWDSMDELPFKIYLENTTKLSKDRQGSLDHLVQLIDRFGWNDLFGVCVDTEHYFATDGECQLFEIIEDLLFKGITPIVHLNTIPEEVKPKSGKDRHSNTTIFECSYKDENWYMETMNLLHGMNILFVREVHEDTMYRELKQLGYEC